MATVRDTDPVDQPVEGVLATRSARNGVGILVRVLAGQVIAAVALVVLSVHLSPAEYGLYAMATGLAAAAYSVVTQPFVRVLVRHEGALQRRDVDAAWTIAATLMGLMGIGAAIVAVLLDRWELVIVSASAYGVFRVLAFPPFVALQRNLHTAKASLITLGDRVAFQVAVVVLTLVGVGIDTTVAAAFGAAAVVGVALAQLLHPWLPRPTSPRAMADRLGQAAHASTIHVSATLFIASLTPVVTALAGEEAGGHFAWAFSINLVVTAFTSALDTVVLPAFARGSDESFAAGYRISTRLMTLLALVGASLITLVVPTLVGPVFPTRWEESLDVLAVLALGGAILTSAIPASSAWVARISFARVARWHVEALVAGVVVLVGLAPEFGAIGGAAGYLAYAVWLAGRLHVASEGRSELPSVTRSVLGWTVATVLVTWGGRTLVDGLDPDWLRTAAATAVALAVVPSVLMLLDRGRLLADVRATVVSLRGRARNGASAEQ